MDLLLQIAYRCVVVLEKSNSTWRSHRVGASCAEVTRDERMVVERDSTKQHIKYAKDVEALYCFINILTTSNVKTQNYKNLDR